MSYLISLITSVLRIVFLRGSPERIYYTRRLFIVSLFLALIMSGLAQAFYHADHPVFVILRVFAELTMFMVMMVLLTAKIVRFRLARMMLPMVLISLMMDSVLTLLSPLPLGTLTGPLAIALGAIAFYGAANCLAWGLKAKLWQAAAYLLAYVAAVTGIDSAFRHLFGMYAGAA